MAPRGPLWRQKGGPHRGPPVLVGQALRGQFIFCFCLCRMTAEEMVEKIIEMQEELSGKIFAAAAAAAAA